MGPHASCTSAQHVRTLLTVKTNVGLCASAPRGCCSSSGGWAARARPFFAFCLKDPRLVFGAVTACVPFGSFESRIPSWLVPASPSQQRVSPPPAEVARFVQFECECYSSRRPRERRRKVAFCWRRPERSGVHPGLECETPSSPTIRGTGVRGEAAADRFDARPSMRLPRAW